MQHIALRWIILVAGIFILSIALVLIWVVRLKPQNRNGGLRTVTVTVGGVPVIADVAASLMEQSRGLSGRTNLPDGRGMVFPYRTPARPSFWMRGMLLSIDIVWIRDQAVVGIAEDVPLPQPGKLLPTYSPPEPVTAVLEVPAGFCRRHQLRVGSVVTFNPSDF